MKKIINYFKLHWYFRMHPDTALRYLPIVDLLKKYNWITSNILEVGSGSYGITPYLKHPVVGLDTEFTEPKYLLLKQVKGSISHLPFTDNQFDITILSDVLEHLPKDIRTRGLNEVIRVTKIAVIISGPFGFLPFTQDQALAKKSTHPFFAEHLKFGLPSLESIADFHHPKILQITKIGEFQNLWIRSLLMHLFVSRSKLIYYVYLKGFMPLIPFLRLCNWPPCYRTLFLLRLNPEYDHESRY